MKSCILVTGIPASGKSTAAREIARRLHIPVFSKDDIKEKLFDTIGFSSRTEKVKLGIAATDILYDTANRMMACGLSFIIENNFEELSKEGLEHLLSQSGYRIVTVRLTGAYDVIYERFLARDQSGERHEGHVVNDYYPRREEREGAPPIPFTLEEFIRGIQARGMDKFSAGNAIIEIDTTDWTSVKWDEIEQEIRKAIKRKRKEDPCR